MRFINFFLVAATLSFLQVPTVSQAEETHNSQAEETHNSQAEKTHSLSHGLGSHKEELPADRPVSEGHGPTHNRAEQGEETLENHATSDDIHSPNTNSSETENKELKSKHQEKGSESGSGSGILWFVSIFTILITFLFLLT